MVYLSSNIMGGIYQLITNYGRRRKRRIIIKKILRASLHISAVSTATMNCSLSACRPGARSLIVCPDLSLTATQL